MYLRRMHSFSNGDRAALRGRGSRVRKLGDGIPMSKGANFNCQKCGVKFSSSGQLANTVGHKKCCTHEERFWARVQKTDNCWLFQGAKEQNGYGYVVNNLGGPKFLTAHRYSWILAKGPIPVGLLVLHRCDVRACVRPDHLFLGTDADNTADKVSKGRHARGAQTAKTDLTEDVVREIRARYVQYHARKSNRRELAAKYGCSPAVVGHIVRGRSWKHVK